jgi:hypothetical protein
MNQNAPPPPPPKPPPEKPPPLEKPRPLQPEELELARGAATNAALAVWVMAPLKSRTTRSGGGIPIPPKLAEIAKTVALEISRTDRDPSPCSVEKS